MVVKRVRISGGQGKEAHNMGSTSEGDQGHWHRRTSKLARKMFCSVIVWWAGTIVINFVIILFEAAVKNYFSVTMTSQFLYILLH